MAVNSTTANAAPQITGAIRHAARASGISFEYLMTTARIESNLNPGAQATTSSAKGLYQFIEQTWLATMKGDGPAHGYGHFADAISRAPDGHLEVANPAMRTAIMRLRNDPAASATMAGAFTRANAEQLRANIGRPPSEGELYIAHFLGPDGASRLIGTAASQPRTSAVEMFPAAAAANPSIFYDGAGRARSASEVYAKLTGRFEAARASSFAPGETNVVTNSVNMRGRQTTARAPDTAGVTAAYAQAHDDLPPLPDTKPLFQAMFTDRARRAVTQTVSSLWAPAKNETPAAQAPARGLDLFTDSPADSRKIFGNS